jgi:hypothetical protein
VTGGDNHLSEQSLDLLLLDRDGSDASRGARAHADACAECRTRLESLRRSARHFELHVRERTEEQVLAALERRAALPPRRRRWDLMALGLTGAAAALLLVTRGASRHSDARGADLLPKGDASLTVYRRHAGAVSVLADGTRVDAGDGLRFTADPAGHRWLLVVSIDSGGHSSVYVPYGGSSSAPIDPERRFEDPGSITLDETGGPERIFALFSDRPLSATDATRALAEIGSRGAEAIRSTRHLPVAAEAQTSLLLEK